MSLRSFVRVSWPVACVGLLAISAVLSQSATQVMAADSSTASPPHQLMVCCFDYPGCCETCQKIVTYTQDAVQSGFADELKGGKVKIQTLDLKDPKNKKLVEAYKIETATIIIMDVQGGKVKQWKSAPEVWKLHPKKDEFLKYIQREVRASIEAAAVSK